MTTIFGSVWASEEIGVTDGHTIKNLIAGIWGEEGQRTNPFTLNDISFLNQPGKHPAFSHTRATVGALCQQFDGSFYQPEIGEIGSHGMRRVRNLLSNTTAAWTGLGAAITAVTVAGPDGANVTAHAVTEDTANSYHYAKQDVLTTGDDCFVQAIVKPFGSGRDLRIEGAGGAQFAWFDLSTGTVLSGIGGIEAIGNGWFKVWGKKLAVTGPQASIVLRSPSGGSYVGDGVSGVYLLDYQATKSRVDQTIPDPEYVSRGVVTAEMLGPNRASLGDFDKREGTDGTVTLSGSVLNFVSAASGLSTSLSAPLTVVAGERYRFKATFRYISGHPSGVRLQFRTADGGGGSDLIGSDFVTSSSFEEMILDYTAVSSGIIYPTFNTTQGLANEIEVSEVSVQRINYHGWGIDGVRHFATDEYGNDLTIGLGPELWDDSATPTLIQDSGGSAGTYSDGTFSNATAGSVSDYPRFGFSMLEVGKQYSVRFEFDEAGKINYVRNANPGSYSFTETTTDQIYEATFTAVGDRIEFRFDGTQTGSVNLVSGSVREVYPVLAAGAVRNPAVTNLCSYANTIGVTGWSSNSSPSSTTEIGGPLGSFTRVTSSATGSGYYKFPVPAAAIGQVYTASVYVRLNTTGAGGQNSLRFAVEGSGVSPAAEAYFNLSTGENTSSSGTSGVTIRAVAGWPGWYRISVSGIATSTNSVAITIYGYDGAGFVWDCAGAQLEASASAGIYVPTTTASVAVAADTESLDPTAWGYDQDGGGVFVLAHTPFEMNLSASPQLLTLYQDGNNQALLHSIPAGNFGAFVSDSGVAQWNATSFPAAWAPGEKQFVAWRLQVDDGALATDGVLRLTDTAMDLPQPVNMWIGGASWNAYSGAIEAVYYFPPGTVTDAELLAMSNGDLPTIPEIA